MNKKILFLLFLTILACSSKPEKPIPEKQLEGWAGNPDNPNEKPFDYFYMISAGRASEKAIAKKNGAIMQSTCTDSATTKVNVDLIVKMVVNTVYFGDPINGRLFTPYPSNDSYALTYSPALKLYFQTKSNPFNTLNLIAITSEELKIMLITEYIRKIQSIELKECKPFAIPDQEIYLSEWKECECIVYAHISGGKDGVIARARELGKE